MMNRVLHADGLKPKKTTQGSIGNATSAGAGALRLINGVKLAISTPDGWHVLPSITPFPRTRQGIISAINSIRTISGSGIIQYEDAVYDLSDYTAGPIILYSGIFHNGIRGRFSFNGSVPDATFTLSGGTIFDGVDGTNHAFELNNSDQVSATSAISASGATFARTANQFASNGQSGFGVENICFRNVNRAIDAGAANNVGALYAHFRWLIAENCKGDYTFNFKNFQHCDFKHIYAKTSYAYGSGIRFCADVDATVLLPGNSTLNEIYNFGSAIGHKTIEISATAASQLNELNGDRIQSNHYGQLTAATFNITTTSGSALATISSSDAQWLQAGMACTFAGAAASPFISMGVVYIASVDKVANTVSLCDAPFGGAAVTFTATGSFIVSTGGFSGIYIGAKGTGLITACKLSGLDIEATGSACVVSLSRLRYCEILFNEQSGGVVGKSLCVRDLSGTDVGYKNLSGITIDLDASSFFIPRLITANDKYVSADITVSGNFHQNRVFNKATTDVKITIPSGLPRRFGMKIMPLSTGKISFVAGSGVTINTAGAGLFASSAGTILELVEVTKDSYLVIGNSSAS